MLNVFSATVQTSVHHPRLISGGFCNKFYSLFKSNPFWVDLPIQVGQEELQCDANITGNLFVICRPFPHNYVFIHKADKTVCYCVVVGRPVSPRGEVVG